MTKPNHNAADVRAFWLRAHQGPRAGTWGVFLCIDGIYGHTGGGAYEATWPMTDAIVDDFGTLVCLEGFR